MEDKFKEFGISNEYQSLITSFLKPILADYKIDVMFGKLDDVTEDGYIRLYDKEKHNEIGELVLSRDGMVSLDLEQQSDSEVKDGLKCSLTCHDGYFDGFYARRDENGTDDITKVSTSDYEERNAQMNFDYDDYFLTQYMNSFNKGRQK